MGHFAPTTDFIVKMTKCRTVVHPLSREVDGQIPPRDHADKLLLWSRSSSDLARHSPDILNGLVFERFTGDYD